MECHLAKPLMHRPLFSMGTADPVIQCPNPESRISAVLTATAGNPRPHFAENSDMSCSQSPLLMPDLHKQNAFMPKWVTMCSPAAHGVRSTCFGIDVVQQEAPGLERQTTPAMLRMSKYTGGTDAYMTCTSLSLSISLCLFLSVSLSVSLSLSLSIIIYIYIYIHICIHI